MNNIIKAIIVEILGNRYRIRIPRKHGVKNGVDFVEDNQLPIASAILPNNFNNVYEEGDIVYIGFEDADEAKPLILGHLYKTNKTNEVASLTLKSLDILGNTNLPKTTHIGAVKSSEISKLEGTKQNIEKRFVGIQDILSRQVSNNRGLYFTNNKYIIKDSLNNPVETFNDNFYLTIGAESVKFNIRWDIKKILGNENTYSITDNHFEISGETYSIEKETFINRNIEYYEYGDSFDKQYIKYELSNIYSNHGVINLEEQEKFLSSYVNISGNVNVIVKEEIPTFSINSGTPDTIEGEPYTVYEVFMEDKNYILELSDSEAGSGFLYEVDNFVDLNLIGETINIENYMFNIKSTNGYTYEIIDEAGIYIVHASDLLLSMNKKVALKDLFNEIGVSSLEKTVNISLSDAYTRNYNDGISPFKERVAINFDLMLIPHTYLLKTDSGTINKVELLVYNKGNDYSIERTEITGAFETPVVKIGELLDTSSNKSPINISIKYEGLLNNETSENVIKVEEIES